MAEAPEEIVDELYGAPLDEFIARRDARAKELRKSDRAAADAVKKLRKPSVSAAAVNRLVRSAPDDVEALLAAGEALRQAQLGGGDRDAVRSAAHDEREAVEKLVGAAGKLSPEHARGGPGDAARGRRRTTRRASWCGAGVLTEARRPVGFAGLAPRPGREAAAEAEARTRTPSARPPRRPLSARPRPSAAAPRRSA